MSRPPAALLGFALAVAPALALGGACRGARLSAAAETRTDGQRRRAAPAARAPRATRPAPTARPGAKRLPRIDVHTHIAPDGIARAVRLMDEWGIDGVRQPVGHVPGAAAQHARDAAGGGGQERRAHRRVHHADFRLVRRADRTTARRWPSSSTEAQRLGAIGLKITKGLGLGYPARRRRAPAGRRRSRASTRCSSGPASWACRSRSTAAIPRRSGSRPRPTTSAGTSCRPTPSGRSTASRRPVLGGALRRVRAARRAPPQDDLHRRPLRQRPRGSRQRRRACSTATPTSSSTPRRACPRSAATRRTRCGASSSKYQDRILFGTDTGVGADQDDMMYGSNGADAADARGRGPLLHADLALLRDARPPVREPDPHPGPLEDRRRRPAGVDPAQDLLRQRRARPALEAARP